MPLIEQDLEPPEDKGILKYQRDDNFFRQPITAGDLADTPRVEFDDFANKDEYLKCIKDLPFVVFIDVSDVAKYLRVVNVDGFGAVDVKHIAEIVCNCLGEDSNIPDMLWCDFEDEVAAEIQAKLGLEDSDTSAVLAGSPFNTSMEVVYEIANVVQRYLINARFPIVENESIYGVAEYKKGLLALAIKPYEAFVEAYGGVDEEKLPLLGGDFDGNADLGPIPFYNKALEIFDPKSPTYDDSDDGALDLLAEIAKLCEQARREREFKESGATWRPDPSLEIIEKYGNFDENGRWVNADGSPNPPDNMIPYNDDPNY